MLNHPAVWYLSCAVVAFALLPLSRSYGVLVDWLNGHQAWLWLVLTAPALAGALVSLPSRRFWAWPYVYLVVLWLAPATPTRDYVDLGVLLANAGLLFFTVALAESLGLSLGHWFSRLFALIYFLVGGLILAGAVLFGLSGGLRSWQLWFLFISSLLYFIQSWIQHERRITARLRAQSGADLPDPPQPVAGAEYLPWTVKVDSKTAANQVGKPADTGLGETDRNRVR